ncbi:MAG: hypothetical protein LBT01_06320 [Spirochaetaceae bacterium]|nr:hypothetical protein [Spirochaetaceae bacterium]
MQTFTATVAGTYKIQVWGARGGIYNNILGGAGGYAEGVVTLTLNQTLYVYVGGAGAVHTNSGGAGGWNGGGKGGARNGSGYGGSGGGGASDVRLVGGAWNEADSLASRFIVAGGGGGKSTRSAAPGVGGGLTGGRYATAGQSAPANPGTAGVGSFGIGAVGYTSIRTGTEYPQRYGGSGGGGGYWGGGADASIANPGGGGSGFVKGFNGCNNTDNFDALSGITVSNPVLYAGNVVFLSPTGVDETGHRDSGYVRITKQSD